MGRSHKSKKKLNNSETNLVEEDLVEEERDEEDDDCGETNLGYVSEASDIIKPKSKEDVKTIRRNLSKSKGDTQRKKETNKKPLVEEETESIRIENKLFEDKNKDGQNLSTNKKKKSKKKRNVENAEEENIELSQMEGRIVINSKETGENSHEDTPYEYKNDTHVKH